MKCRTKQLATVLTRSLPPLTRTAFHRMPLQMTFDFRVVRMRRSCSRAKDTSFDRAIADRRRPSRNPAATQP